MQCRFCTWGRALVLPAHQCIRSMIRLDGNSDEQGGIGQCRHCILSLMDMRKQQVAARSKSSALDAPQGTDPDSLDASQSQGPVASDVASVVVSAEEAEPEADPVREAAAGLTELELSKLAYYSDGLPAHLADEPRRHLPQCAQVAMVAAPHEGGTEEMPCAIPALPKRRFLRLAMHEPGMWP